MLVHTCFDHVAPGLIVGLQDGLVAKNELKPGNEFPFAS